MTEMAKAKAAQRAVTQLDGVIGNRLRARRLELNVTQSQLAQQLGVSFQQVQKYERGVNRLSGSRLVQVANMLKTDVAYFMGDLTDKAPVSELASFLATKHGLAINQAMLRLDATHRKAVIGLARTLAEAYGTR
jgi:transcriptional regulator with XRE-family HTH domain